MFAELLLEIAVVALVGIASFAAGAVDFSGFLAALFLGSVIIALPPEGWRFFLVLLTCHILTYGSTRYRFSQKAALGVAQSKGGARRWSNVAANVGVAAALATAYSQSPSPLLAAGFVGAISAATSDTLSTEIGLLSSSPPKLITSPKQRVEPGFSGGVTLLGMVVAAAGGCVIGGVSQLLGVLPIDLSAAVALGGASGLAGSLFDSLLGATVQQIYLCERCGKLVEEKIHCGQPTKRVRGVPPIENNFVNLFATMVGAASASATLLALA